MKQRDRDDLKKKAEGLYFLGILSEKEYRWVIQALDSEHCTVRFQQLPVKDNVQYRFEVEFSKVANG